MTLRITTRLTRGKSVVQVDGKLSGEEVRELERTCRAVGPPFALDLANLECADEAGLRLLKALATRGAEMRGLSTYLTLLLEGVDTS